VHTDIVIVQAPRPPILSGPVHALRARRLLYVTMKWREQCRGRWHARLWQ